MAELIISIGKNSIYLIYLISKEPFAPEAYLCKFKTQPSNLIWICCNCLPIRIQGKKEATECRVLNRYRDILYTNILYTWQSLYKHSLYVTKFIRTFFIRDSVYTGQSLYGTKFIQGQSLYEDKVYTGTKFIRDKVYTVTMFIQGQSLYKLFSFCT